MAGIKVCIEEFDQDSLREGPEQQTHRYHFPAIWSCFFQNEQDGWKNTIKEHQIRNKPTGKIQRKRMRKPGLQTEKIQKELGKRQVTGKSPEHHRHQECQKIKRQYLYCTFQKILPEDKLPPLIPQKQHESRQNKEKCNHLGACFEYHRHLRIILNLLAKVKKNHDAGRKKSENREYRCIYGSRFHLFGN